MDTPALDEAIEYAILVRLIQAGLVSGALYGTLFFPPVGTICGAACGTLAGLLVGAFNATLAGFLVRQYLEERLSRAAVHRRLLHQALALNTALLIALPLWLLRQADLTAIALVLVPCGIAWCCALAIDHAAIEKHLPLAGGAGDRRRG